jgi:hypothetical protein
MKVVTISAMFPELKGGDIYRTARGEGSTVRAAGARAFAELIKQKKGKRKHITEIKATIHIGTMVDTPEGQS